MNNFVVTIGREFGSGGREIGEKLAERLEFNFYNDRLLSDVSHKTGIDKSLFEDADEKQKEASWYMMAMNVLNAFGKDKSVDELPSSEQLFLEQSKFIEELAENENCVVVGRCSNYLLKNKPNALHVFIFADEDTKIRRIMERQELSEKDAKKHMQKIEKERKEYYEYYTGKKYGNFQDYDLCISSSKCRIEEIAAIIERLVRNRIIQEE